MGARIGCVLGDLRQEVQRIEYLEVARGTREQIPIARLREAAHGVVLRLVDDFVRQAALC